MEEELDGGGTEQVRSFYPKVIQEYCPSCKRMVSAELEYEFIAYMMITDISKCPCGRILWEWHWGQPFVALIPPTPVAPPAPIRGQLRLF